MVIDQPGPIIDIFSSTEGLLPLSMRAESSDARWHLISIPIMPNPRVGTSVTMGSPSDLIALKRDSIRKQYVLYSPIPLDNSVDTVPQRFSSIQNFQDTSCIGHVYLAHGHVVSN